MKTLLTSLLTKDLLQPPKPYRKGSNIALYVQEFEAFLQLRCPLDSPTQARVLMSFLDEDVQLQMKTQPGFQQNCQSYDWIKKTLLDLYEHRARNVLSPLVYLMHVKQKPGQSLPEYASDLRVALYNTGVQMDASSQEDFLVSAFINGMTNKEIACSLQTIKPGRLEDALKLAKENESSKADASEGLLRRINGGGGAPQAGSRYKWLISRNKWRLLPQC